MRLMLIFSSLLLRILLAGSKNLLFYSEWSQVRAFTTYLESLIKRSVPGKSRKNKYAKNIIHLPRQHLSFPHGRICYEKIGIRRESRRSLPDRFRCHQHGGDLERHREPGLSAGEGGACQARNLLRGKAGQAGNEGRLCGI